MNVSVFNLPSYKTGTEKYLLTSAEEVFRESPENETFLVSIKLSEAGWPVRGQLKLIPM